MNKYFKQYNRFKLNELNIHVSEEDSGDDLEGKYFISYRGDVWIFDEDEWENEFWDTVNSKTGIDFDEYWDEAIDTLEKYPQLLNGKIEDGKIKIDGTKNNRHSSLSADLKKLSKYLGMEVEVYSYKNIDDEEEFFEEELFDSIKDATFYHGTCIKFLDSISKTGIKSNDKSNFGKIVHKDKIFVTTNLEKAKFHSFKASEINNSYPIILEFKIPDPSKLVIDYDLAIELLGIEDEETKRLGYDKIAKSSGRDGNYKSYQLLDGDEKIDIAKKMGVYGYLGRIPASMMKVIIDVDTLEENWVMFDDNLGYGYETDIKYDSEIFVQMDDVGEWSLMSIKQVQDKITSFEENLEDEDEDEDYE